MSHSNPSKSLDITHSGIPTFPDTDLRCHCGRLIAKQTPKGIEIRCPRCKRTWTFSKKRLSSPVCE